MKKIYEPPSVVHTEKLEVWAIVCNKENSACGAGGAPIQS